jgi:hypothetical protein
LAPWVKRVEVITDKVAAWETEAGWAICIAVSSSARNDVVGVDGAVQIPLSVRGGPKLETSSFTLGMRIDQNPYNGELAAMAYALRRTLPKLKYRSVALITSNKAAALRLKQPRQQSEQEYIRCIYDLIEDLREDANIVRVLWLPSSDENELLKLAKAEARTATQQGASFEIGRIDRPNMNRIDRRSNRSMLVFVVPIYAYPAHQLKNLPPIIPFKETKEEESAGNYRLCSTNEGTEPCPKYAIVGEP